MLLDLFREYQSGSGQFTDLLIGALLTMIVVLFSLSFHEFAHGYVAYKLGDPTADRMGRLTLNPLVHLDPLGTICMLLCGFGWAKPVPVSTRFFRKPKRDMALTAFAGPVSNILLAFVCMLSYRLLILAFGNVSLHSEFVYFIVLYTIQLFWYGHVLNLYLAVFNLIPIPPLDGSRLLFIFLPDKYYFGLMKYEQIIKIVFFVLLWSGVLSLPLSSICNVISYIMDLVISFIPGL